jgi:type IV pilus assembly protein PilC
MAIYTWEGKSSDGKKVRGSMDAPSSQAVFNTLRAQRISPNVKKIREKNAGMQKEIKIPGLGPKVKVRDVVIFTRQFATMIDAGLPLVQGLEALGRQHDNPAMRKTLLSIKEYIQSGGTLAEGLKLYPKVFDELYTNMVAAGEAGGILDIILERLAIYLEKAASLKRQVKTALIYPGVVVSAAAIVSSILLIFVIPTFAELFSDFGSTLPAPTRWVMALSSFMVGYWHVIFGTLALGFYFLKRFLKTRRGQEILHPIALKTPVFGEIIRKVAVARFTRTLGTMLSSGVSILEALTICGKTAGNIVVEQEILRIKLAISEGKMLSDPLQDSVVFPPMVVQMLNVGQSTGALDAMLHKIADFYEEEVDTAVGAMKQLIEPIMILVLGVLVGGLVIAMYLPIFKMGSVVG